MKKAIFHFAILYWGIVIMGPISALGEKVLTVPFTLERNMVIIPAVVNGSAPLRLILDTGMRFDGVYLFHKEALNLIDTLGAVEVRVPGAGSGEPSRATMIENGSITFGQVSAGGQRIIVSYSEHTQSFRTDGVIGWNLFGHYSVEIDYDQLLVFLRDTSYQPADTGWFCVPVEMKEDLPFFEIIVEVVKGEVVPIRVYIDLASGAALELLVHKGQKFTLPDSLIKSTLGTGLSGDINGQLGRSLRLQIGPYILHDIRTAFAPEKVRSKTAGADGIFGNDLIRRFNVVFDYPHNRLYIRPNQTFGVPFE